MSRQTEIKIQVGKPTVNAQTKKVYICPFTGKVFGDNTHPNPQDAIYDWVSRCPENTERVNGLKVKRCYVSEDPEIIQNYIEKAMGTYFIKPNIYSLEEVFLESKSSIPIILILTPGNDPMEQIRKFAEDKNRLPLPISLGKGQGEKAKTNINEIRYGGGWIVLQNCHLAQSFLPELE